MEKDFMMTTNSAGDASRRIEKALEKIAADLPALANVVAAFTDLLIERARLKEEISIEVEFPVSEINADLLRQGAPIAGREMFSVSAEDLKLAAERLIPAMKRGLPGVEADLEGIRNAVLDGTIDLEATENHFLMDRTDEIARIAHDVGTNPEMLGFVMGQLTKPFVEKRAESLAAMLEGLHWEKGYCPLCGSWPSLSFLKDKEGRRFLKCSFCGNEWRFARTVCPFCENRDHETIEHLFAQDRSSERIEVCHKCKRYVLSLDLRERAEELVLEVASLGLIHLDILAQQKGFTPGALTEWNVIDRD
jgi:FdhE protein